LSKAFVSTKLNRQLAAVVLVSFAISAGLYFAVSPVIVQAVCAHYMANPAITQKKAHETLDAFAAYVRDRKIAVQDTSAISQWVERHPLLILQVHRDEQLLYDSTLASSAGLHTHLAQQAPSTHQMCQNVLFTDGPTSVSLSVFPEYTMVNWLTKMLLGACGLLFLAIILKSVQRKVQYLVQLENEVQSIAGGELNLPITIRGSDELAMLAECVDGMRSSLLERIHDEEARGQENYAVTTTLAHDLRTPLTSLSGYLEVLCRQDISETQRTYVAKCIEKAAQLKEISDLLFAGLSESAASSEKLDLLPANELIDQWIGEYVDELSGKGFSVEQAFTDERCTVFVQRTSLRRVLNNVFSNIEMYAEISMPIQISAEKNEKGFWIVIQNRSERDMFIYGSGLGLAICEGLMRNMHGIFETNSAEGIFLCRLGWHIVM